MINLLLYFPKQCAFFLGYILSHKKIWMWEQRYGTFRDLENKVENQVNKLENPNLEDINKIRMKIERILD